MKHIHWILTAAVVPACLAEAQNINFEHDGLTRQYRIHTPPNLQANSPLVIALHGYSGNNNDMRNNYGWTELSDEKGFVVAFPNGTNDQSNNRFWDVGYDFHQGIPSVDDNGFISELAVHLQDLHDLDPTRTFVTGFSNGAEMCLQLACMESVTFSAFAAICPMMLEPLFTNCNPTITRPILSMSGTNDNVTWYQGDLQNAGGWGSYPSIPATMALWVDILEVPNVERTTLPDTNPNDGSTVRLDVFSSTQHPKLLKYYLVLGGGHDWPGEWGNMDINATEEAWDFFASITDGNFVAGDVNRDGKVDGSDLSIILGFWGGSNTDADVNNDGIIDGADVTIVLGNWGSGINPP